MVGPVVVPRFYLASSEPAGAVSACACGNFLRANDRTLAIARKDQLDIMGFTSEGLKILTQTRLAHAIHSMITIRPFWAKNDLIFMLLQNLDILILEFGLDSQGRPYIQTRAGGSAADKVGRVNQQGYLISADPENRCIALHIYESLIRIIPLNKEPMESKELETFNVRVDENFISSVTFLHNAEVPTLALLYKDSTGSHITSYDVDFREKDLKAPPPLGPRLEFKDLESEILSLIAVPGTHKGVVGCGIRILAYMDADNECITAAIKKENRGVGIVHALLSDTDMQTKVLVGDLGGNMHVIRLKKAATQKPKWTKVVELGVISLGKLVIPSCIVYLDNRVVFVGSKMADSHVIRFREEPHPETGNLFDVLENLSNIGCVGDFILVRPETLGTQPQMIVCSGFGPGTSARIVRSGIGVQETTSLDAPTGRQVFGVNSRGADDGPHDMLVMSFLNETKVLKMEDEIGEFEDMAEVGGFITEVPTFLVTKIAGLIVQVTASSIRAIEPVSLALRAEWFPSNRSLQIGIAACYKRQIVAAAFDTLIIVSFDLSGHPVVQEVKLDEQISAVDIHSFAGADTADYIVAATWKMDLILFSGPNWQPVASVDLNSDVFARSVLLCQLDSIDYIIAGLGDGTLQYFLLDRARNKFGQAKRVSVGTQPTYLKSFVARGMTSIFVCNDRPSVIHSSAGKLIFSSVNMKHVFAVARLNSPIYPNCLAIVTESGLVIGRMDDIQKLHIRSISLPGSARRVAYQPETGTYGFITMEDPMASECGGSGDSEMLDDSQETEEEPCGKSDLLPSFKLLITDQNNHQILTTYQFNRHEAVQTIVSGSLGTDNRTFFIVGTGICKPEEKECTSGRIIIFQYLDKHLNIVMEKPMKSFTTQLLIFKRKLLLTCGSSLRLMNWNDEGELVPEHTVNRFIMPCFLKTKGDFVMVGDMMRSITVMVYRSAENKFDVIAEDPFPRWPTACEFLDDDVYVVADGMSNILFLRRDTDPSNAETKDLTQVAGTNSADAVNVIRKGTLLPDTAVSERIFAQNGLVLATQSGSVMNLLSIDENAYHVLKQLSDKMVRSLMPFGRTTPQRYSAIISSTGYTSQPSEGVIMGDLIEMFASMSSEDMQEIIAGVTDIAGASVTIEAVARLVEELSRSH